MKKTPTIMVGHKPRFRRKEGGGGTRKLRNEYSLLVGKNMLTAKIKHFILPISQICLGDKL